MAKGKGNGTTRKARFRLADVDMGGRLDPALYEKRLKELHGQLLCIQQAYLKTGNSAAVLFEGWDASGKGGTIRRITTVLDPRGIKVWPIAAPRAYYQERHYFVRFWERLPAKGTLAIFDRSWYGRVLVERVEGFATVDQWQRAYDEINDFERLLIDEGTRVVKFFMHITPDEQLRRFKSRLRDPVKRWKLTADDFRNRRRWDDYTLAVEDMVERTTTSQAPWHVIPANDKKAARIAAIEILCQRLSQGVDLTPAPIGEELAAEAKAVFGRLPGED